jgi:TolB protein
MNARISIVFLTFLAALPAAAQTPPGIFESETDIGTLSHPGASEYDAAKKTYTLTSSGENMWADEDDFHFVWKKVTGDITLTADISFPATTGNAHKKGVLMARRSLDKDSDYVDAAFHLAGLTSLQSRDQKGATTREVQSYMSSPKKLRLAKRGNYFFMYVAGADGVFHLSGGSMKLALDQPFYVGIGACAHDKDGIEKVAFSDVDLAAAPASTGTPKLFSTLEAVPVQSTDRRAVHVAEGKLEAPGWSKDGKTLLFASDGHIVKIPAAGGTPEPLKTGGLTHNGVHFGISPDGTKLALTEESKSKASIYVALADGGSPKGVTKLSPSWFQSWSPDGKTILLTGRRKVSKLDKLTDAAIGVIENRLEMYTIPVKVGLETPLNAGEGTNPVYSPDGKYIYFDSTRGTGIRQIWRMLADGTKPEQVTTDDFANWHPHVSPDGTQVAFLTCDKALADKPENKDIKVRSLVFADRVIRVISNLFGGEGTFGTNPWSADSKTLSYVSYQMIPQ